MLPASEGENVNELFVLQLLAAVAASSSERGRVELQKLRRGLGRVEATHEGRNYHAALRSADGSAGNQDAGELRHVPVSETDKKEGEVGVRCR